MGDRRAVGTSRFVEADGALLARDKDGERDQELGNGRPLEDLLFRACASHGHFGIGYGAGRPPWPSGDVSPQNVY